MAKVNIKQNRSYFNTIFFFILNSTIGEDFYINLFSIYANAKEFISLRETKSYASTAELDTSGLNTSVDSYTNALSSVINNISNRVYDPLITQKFKDITSHFNSMITNLDALNNQLNPLADSAESLQQLVKEITSSYKKLQSIGTKRIYSADCKEDCRVNFLSRVGNSMKNTFETNWQLALTESKTLITLANTAMQVVSKCPLGTEPITEASLKKLKNAIFNFEHLIG